MTGYKVERLAYIAWRGFTRTVTVPARFLKEGPAKTWVRTKLLLTQHSLPTELAVNSGDTIVQIGTPWPRTMHRFRRAIGPEGRLVIFEAMPDNQARLAAAIAEAGYTNVHLIKAAASSEPGQGKLLISPYNGDHKLEIDGVKMDNDLRPENAQMQEVPVRLTTIDDELEKLGIERLDYLSVTVNGAELEVLKGAERTLRAAHPWMRLYSKGHARTETGAPLNEPIRAYLGDLGFRVMKTKGEPSSTFDPNWRWRAGDVFAWMPASGAMSS